MGRWDQNKSRYNKNEIITLFLIVTPIMSLLIIFYVNPVSEVLNIALKNSFPDEQRGSLLALGVTVWLLSGYIGPMYLILKILYKFTPKISKRIFFK